MAEKVPTEVYIGGKWYDIELKTKSLLDQGNMGECHPEKCEIYINDYQNEQQLRDTLFHEVLHGVFHYTGLSHELKEDDIPKPSEETLIQRLTPAVLTLFRENPHLVKFLTGD